jgi:hypothetical protein
MTIMSTGSISAVSMTPLKLFKGTVSRDFLPSVFFSLNCTPGSPDSWAKTVLHIDSNSRIYSIKFDDENQKSRDTVPLSGGNNSAEKISAVSS